jgi:hypothetical protein
MKIKITTHSGLEDEVTVESYDPIDINTQMNDGSIHSILIGDNIYSRIDLKNIKVIEK